MNSKGLSGHNWAAGFLMATGKILLTGASGFVGGHALQLMDCVPLATESNGPVELTDRDQTAAEVKRIHAVSRFAGVLHLAAQSDVPTSISDPDATYAANFTGTQYLLEALAEAGFGGRVLFVGSGNVYGIPATDQLPLNETHPLRPRNPYAVSKVAAEALCYMWSQTGPFEVVLVRPFNHVGPAQDPRFAVANFARQVAEIRLGRREPVIAAGNLDVTRDFTDVRDVVKAYGMLLRHGRNGEVYNVCSGIERNLREIVEALAATADIAVEIRTAPEHLRPADIPRLFGDPGKLAAETGWHPQIPWERTLTDIITNWTSALAKD